MGLAEMSQIMERAAQHAKAESRRMGIPIPLDGKEGEIRYELPDGTIVNEDPWHGQNTAPEGWYERFGITPENRPKTKRS